MPDSYLAYLARGIGQGMLERERSFAFFQRFRLFCVFDEFLFSFWFCESLSYFIMIYAYI